MKIAQKELKRQHDADPALAPAAKKQRAKAPPKRGWIEDKTGYPRQARCEDGVHSLVLVPLRISENANVLSKGMQRGVKGCGVCSICFSVCTIGATANSGALHKHLNGVHVSG